VYFRRDKACTIILCWRRDEPIENLASRAVGLAIHALVPLAAGRLYGEDDLESMKTVAWHLEHLKVHLFGNMFWKVTLWLGKRNPESCILSYALQKLIMLFAE
jgi:hypothetical protein